MIDFYQDIKKRDCFGKLGALVVKSDQDLETLPQKFSHFNSQGVEVLVISSILPNDTLYKNCNFLIWDTLQKNDPLTLIWNFAQDKSFGQVSLWDEFIMSVPTGLYDSVGFIDQISKLSQKKENFVINFLEGAYLHINFDMFRLYHVQFIDRAAQNILFSTDLVNGGWSRTTLKYFVDYQIKIWDKLSNKLLLDYILDFRDKNIYVGFESSALGDTLAWFGQLEDFKKKHSCNLIVSTFHNYLFESKYPDFKFIKPGEVAIGIHAQYRLGWFYNESSQVDLSMHPRDFKTLPLHQTTADILGLEFRQVRPKIQIPDLPKSIEGDYVCVGFHSTTQAKYWNNPEGWQKLTDFFTDLGWKVVIVSREGNGWMGNSFPSGVIDKSGNWPLEDRINDIKWSKMFIGLGSGLSWLAWAIGVPQTIISGFSHPWTEPIGDGIIRIHNSSVCNSCFNRHRLDGGDWLWCPDKSGTVDQFICTRSITSDDIIPKIADYFGIEKLSTDKTLKLLEKTLLSLDIKTINFFTQKKYLKDYLLGSFVELRERGASAIITDKSPEIVGELFNLLVKKGGVVVYWGLDDYGFIKDSNKRYFLYQDPDTDQNFCILFV